MCRDDISIHITCESEGEVLEEDGIVEMPAVGNRIDDGVGAGAGFEEAGSAIESDGFGGGGAVSQHGGRGMEKWDELLE